ncbi:DUF2642 domain-containing protein [Psychrobacillus sp.]|uniref:DUF2642 domain-containing protein n=1 Tax=Psychrobacillus sp. TaxID=1871623 RepID=UPI0028BE7145|nr:DUF2642 domain-containing protein [Psychrobacillus sp.]
MKEQTFEQVLCAMKNTEIGLFLKNNQFIKGILVDVKQDHLVVEVAQKVYYLPLQQIHALSKNAKDFLISPRIIPHLNKNHLTDLLKAMKYNWVSINSLSNQEVFGVLSSILEDHIILINNMELLYVPKSYISSIYSILPKEQIILINEKQPTDEYLEAHLTNESVGSEEHFTLEESSSIKRDNRILLTEWIPTNNDDYVETIPEKVSFFHQNDAKKQTESLLEEDMQEPHQGEQAIFLHLESLSNNEFDISIELPITDKQTEEELEVEEEANLFQLNSNDILENHEEILEPNKNSITSHPTSDKEKRILLTAWSPMNHDPSALPNLKKTSEKSKLIVHDESSIQMEPIAEFNISFIQEKYFSELKNNKLIECSGDTPLPDETNVCQELEKRKNPKEEKAMLVKQYYALMKHAEENLIKLEHRFNSIIQPTYANKTKTGTASYGNIVQSLESEATNSFHLPKSIKEEIVRLEKQYLSLMRHAAKMYRQLRDY